MFNTQNIGITFSSRGEAERVTEKMEQLIGRYGYVTVKDLYEVVGIDSSKASCNYGWFDLGEVHISWGALGQYSLIFTDCISLATLGVFDSKKEIQLDNESESIKMPPERFQELLDELDGNSLQTLKEKNARYSTDGDSLHNFRSGAEIAGGTPAQACWGYMTKHLVALRDMVMRNDFSNREDFLEKCQDTINYIRFLWCIGNEEKPEFLKKELNVPEEKETERDRECAYESCDGSTCIGPKAFNDCPGYSKCELYTPNSFAK